MADKVAGKLEGLQEERIKALNDKEVRDGDYVLYWMQRSQRSEYNHALEVAVGWANELSKPLLVGFGLTDDYPEANERHYRFMLEGLKDVEEALEKRGIPFVLRKGQPDEVALDLGARASLIVCDRSYLRPQRAWRERVAEEAKCCVLQVESDVVVPVELASAKKEYAARTLRPKLKKHLQRFLVELPEVALKKSSMGLKSIENGLDLGDVDALLRTMKLDRSAPSVNQFFGGGTSRAKERLDGFLEERFGDYAENRNQPQTSDVSHMSKYLHFGQISPLYVALRIREANASEKNVETYLEEIIVRRELPMNFVYYEPDYDAYKCLPDWAKKTLAEHRDDQRRYVYTRAQLENAETHDPYWNAAMREMRVTGYMHNYMRMYWGKKILEWTNTPEYAHQTTLYLNNKYFLDGRDANSFANVAWVFGQHDRPWQERAVFGKVRYMSAEGLKRKAKPEAYIKKVDRLIEEGEAP